MPSFHQPLLSTSHKNNNSTSLWTLHQKEGTHPHPILQFFWLKKIQKSYQETKRSTTNLSKQTFPTSPLHHLSKKTPRVLPNHKTKTAILSAVHHPKTLPAIGPSRRPPQKRLFLAPAIESTLRSRQALQPLQAKSVPTLRCDDSSGMVGVVVVWVWGRCFGN